MSSLCSSYHLSSPFRSIFNKNLFPSTKSYKDMHISCLTYSYSFLLIFVKVEKNPLKYSSKLVHMLSTCLALERGATKKYARAAQTHTFFSTNFVYNITCTIHTVFCICPCLPKIYTHFPFKKI